MAQYDSIGSQYDVIKTTFFNRVEQFNFRKNVEPYLQNHDTTVIDFACGTGFYSHLLLSWGAASLTGIDISHKMLAGAISRLSATSFAPRASFVQGDGVQPQPYLVAGSEGFDIATGVWFLNYARDMEQLTCMFRSISINLKSTGVFVGVCPCPTDDVASLAAKSYNGPLTGVRFEYPEALDNGLGYRKHVIVESPPGSDPSIQGVDFWA
ncbi:hypothetical protein CBS63078_11144 [Aspergillus niger]|nr:hypothetical protein CBS13152_11077 [Aspergillus niger]GLA78713.1 hypothetical protein AtubIFM55763_011727 [Aspergillus tubingensis]KAI2871222.1 hypothetical protein CBS11852_11006 [Aspergillus niger]KAI2885622.1 hypothetical protein CBS63078_11144 [Aspergillus niger]KAI3015198.1 hypothetical protein CBS147347_11262 [Aspergillus niger]